MRDESSPRGRISPTCLICHSRLSVRALIRQAGTVRYWTCDDCQVAWVTRDAIDPPEKAAWPNMTHDQKPTS